MPACSRSAISAARPGRSAIQVSSTSRRSRALVGTSEPFGLGSTILAHKAGLSPALGALVAGLLLGESPFAVQIRADVSSLRTLFVTVFFTSIGMLGNPNWMLANWHVLLGTVLAIVVGKSIVAWGALRLFGATAVSALAAGVCLGQIGEFSFILCEVARGSLISDDVFQLLVSSTVLTMLLTPYLVASATKVAERLVGARGNAEAPLAGLRPLPAHPQVVVIGFGPTGRVVAEQMRKDHAEIAVLDLNPHRVAEARRLGFDAFLGDGQHEDVLRHLHVRTATVIAVTVPAPRVTIQIVRLLRGVAPESFVVARSRYNRSLPRVEDAGATIVLDEETNVGLRMAESMKELFPSRENSVDARDEVKHADGCE